MQQLMTVCLVLAMVFSGMYFEKLKVDSQFVVCNFPNNPSAIRAAEPTEVVAHYPRTGQELRSIVGTREMKMERRNRMESFGLRLLLLMAGSFSLNLCLAFLRECGHVRYAAHSSFFIISYIHNRDGKK